MRKIMNGAIIALLFVGFALVSGANTPAVASNIGPLCWAGSCPDMNEAPAATHPRLAAVFQFRSPYACGIESPAYTFYYNAKAVACPADGKLAITPNPKGSN